MSESPRFFNRELSWLQFNRRVLEEAQSAENPLLERVRFLSITASNLDEFFMVRVGSLQILVEQGNDQPDPSGMTPREQLAAIRREVTEFVRLQYACYNEELQPRLRTEGIRRLKPEDWTAEQAATAERLFFDELFSVLTPQAVTGAEDWPLLIGGTMNLCVRLAADAGGEDRFALIPFGRGLRRFVTLPAARAEYHWMLVEDLAVAFIEHFFPGETILEAVPFRITRNADLSVQEDEAADLLAEMQQVLDERKESACVRLEVDAAASDATLHLLQRALGADDDRIYQIPGPLDLADFAELSRVPGDKRLFFPAWRPRSSPEIDPQRSMFENVAEHDIVLYHPYEAFDPVVRLLQEAARDPDVLAIKQTLYRTAPDSAIVAALIEAAENGKHVTAIVELKARFDEARNIRRAKELERAGVQVFYGVKRLKTHAKVCIIVRREAHGIQRYIHFGTGNYNEQTARLYTDISLLTADHELGSDAVAAFNAITGYSQPQRFRQLDMAPLGLRTRLLELIDGERQRAVSGQPARIRAKMNSLVDPEIIDALYAASSAGVEILLNVRGICCLRPQVPGLSETITVTSIVGRFLEHARIFHFHRGGDDVFFISSADWMPRNLDRRVELLVPVNDARNRERLNEILDVTFRDNCRARVLQPDGSYVRRQPAPNEPPIDSQWWFCELARRRERDAHRLRDVAFEPHRAPAD
ncbi:MAG: polyphosphate kinase 1 [Planctomycetota bacterium]|nr:MAG: polyphosphate kinase 1 [Planctomycetota bacterium]